MAQHARVRLRIEDGTVERAWRLFDVLTGVPIPPARKEAMFQAVIHDGLRLSNGRPVRLPKRED
jgi:hypothetical protein